MRSRRSGEDERQPGRVAVDPGGAAGEGKRRQTLRTRDLDALHHFEALRPALLGVLGAEEMAPPDSAICNLRFAQALTLLVRDATQDQSGGRQS
jgi:hypothetical protein